VGALLTALFIQAGMFIILRRWRQADESLLPKGMALGFGIGLIAQVFTGLNLIGAGYRLIYGDISSTSTLSNLASARPPDLFLALVPLILFRPALLVVSAVQGVLVGRSIQEGKNFFWLAVLINVSFAWGILALQLALGGENPGQVALSTENPAMSWVAIVYYTMALILGYRWLLTQVMGLSRAANKIYKRKGS
jgi:hypothetical protein